MKAYVLITGIVFCLSLAHIWRAVEEGPQVATALWFILVAILSAALCVWRASNLALAAIMTSCIPLSEQPDYTASLESAARYRSEDRENGGGRLVDRGACLER